MKLENTGQDVLDLDFEVPAAGKSVLVIEEGIRKNYNENSGKTTLKIPLMIDSVIEGPEGNQGLKLVHFVPIESTWGERQTGALLVLTNLVDDFAQKFGTEVDITGDEFIDRLKLKLPGKFVTAIHTTRPDKNGKERANIIRFERVSKPKVLPAEGDAAVHAGAATDWDE
jgi:hypothetical protein